MRHPLAALLLTSLALPAQAPSVVVGAHHPLAGDAVYTSDRGLVLRAPARADLQLGTAAGARFTPGGDLWFARSVDRGHEEVARSWWVLPRNRTIPRPAGPDEVVPPAAAIATGPELVGVKVCLDAGHGGSDPGALGNGLRESDINLDVVLRLRQLMVLDSQTPSQGGVWNALVTRSTDVYISLGQRTSTANAFGAASFLSVHMNAFSSSSAQGTETYCYPGTQQGTAGRLRAAAHGQAISAWNRVDRGEKTANFYVLRNTNMPAALLEGGFITNVGDAAVMRDPLQRQALALGMLFALQSHHGFAIWDPTGNPGQPTVRGTVWDGSRGTSARLGSVLVASGDGSFTTTDANGDYTLALPSSGVVHVAVTAPGFEPAWGLLQVPPNSVRVLDFGMVPADVPQLTLMPGTPVPGWPFSVSAEADAGTPAALVVATGPRLPPIDLNGIGLGQVWPDLNGSLTVPLAVAGTTGFSLTVLPTPAVPGLILHTQALVTHNGSPRLTNGAALRIR